MQPGQQSSREQAEGEFAKLTDGHKRSLAMPKSAARTSGFDGDGKGDEDAYHDHQKQGDDEDTICETLHKYMRRRLRVRNAQ